MLSKCFGGVVFSLAGKVEKTFEDIPDLAERDRALRNYLAKNAPCPVEGAVWSLVNVVDYNFDGFSSSHLTDHSRLAATKAIADVPRTPNLTVVRDLGLAAKLAYEDPKVVRYICNKWNMMHDTFLSFSFQDTQAYIMYDDHNLVLSFRGTEMLEPRDWTTDVKIKFVNMRPRRQINELVVSVEDIIKKPMAHLGFLSALGLHTQEINSTSSPYSQIHQIVSSLVFSSQRKLWVTGHSLGAALSSIFVAQMLVEDDPLLGRLGGIYTYGQPRCGNQVYCNLFSNLEKRGLLYRIVNKKDVVTHMPMEFLKYKHHGCEVSVVGSRRIVMSHKSLSEGKVVRKLAKGKYKGPVKSSPLKKVVFALLPEFLEDHYPCEYVRNIERFMNESKVEIPPTPAQQKVKPQPTPTITTVTTPTETTASAITITTATIQATTKPQQKVAWWGRRKRATSDTRSIVLHMDV